MLKLTLLAIIVSLLCFSFINATPLDQVFEAAIEQQQPLGLPTNLCQEDSVPLYSLLNDTTNAVFYFMSYDLCKQTALTPSIDSLITCSKGQFQVAQLPGNDYSRLYNNSDCGRLYANSTVLARNDSTQITVKFYNEATTNDTNYVRDNITSDFLLLTINCVPESVMIVDVALRVSNISWLDSKVTLVNSTAVCKDRTPNNKNGDDGGTSAGVYIAIALVLTFVCIFASVLYRAKMAGDRLRALKRARGEKAFLG